MYQSILKTATNNPNFKFAVRSTPFPPTYWVKVRIASTNSGSLSFIGGIAYAMMITAIASNIVVERLEGLKHLQVISGMQLKAYWVGNFIFDFFKLYFTIIVTVILFYGYGLD
jgi:ATP-binding cassette subfamily A (ABC1) protein 3